MALETASFINGLVTSNPLDTDSESQGSGHLRLIKAVLLATFPNLTGAMTVPQALLNSLVAGNGTAVRFNGAVPVGSMHWFPQAPSSSIMASGGTAAGTEQFLECDGSSYPTSKFPDLAASGMVVITGSNFAMPQMNDTGRFLRARTSLVAAGTSQANQTASHTHANSLTDPGHTHVNTLSDPGHAHTITDPGHTHSIPNLWSNTSPTVQVQAGGGTPLSFQTVTGSNTTGISINSHTTGVTITNVSATTGISINNAAAGSGTETRPEALVAVCCLKT